MRIAALALSVLVITLTSGRKNCLRQSEELLRYSNLLSVSDSVLVRSTAIVRKISGRCARDGMSVVRDGRRLEAGSVIGVYGRICEKSVTKMGAETFIAFRLENWASGDENYALALERIFARRPDVVLEKISRLDDSLKVPVLNEIVWGFINNRRFGPVDPFGDETYRPVQPREIEPKEVLNKFTFRGIFFDLNPKMHALDDAYGHEIRYILKQAQNYFETWGDLK